MADHEFGVVPHDWLSLQVETPHHFVTPPGSNEADDVSFHSGTEECHGACCPKGPRRDIFIRESQMGSREEFDRGIEMGCDHSGGHVCPTFPRSLETGKRGVRGGGRSVVGGALLAAAMPPLGIKAGLLWPHGLFLHLTRHFSVG